MFVFFFFNDTATTEIYTLSLHDALPIYQNYLGTEVHSQIYLFNSSSLLWSKDIGGLVTGMSISKTFVGVASTHLKSATEQNMPLYFFVLKNGREIWTFQARNGFWDVSLSRDGAYVVAGSRDGNIYFLDRSGDLLWTYKTQNWVRDVSLSENGELVVAWSQDSNLYLLDKKGVLLWKYDTGLPLLFPKTLSFSSKDNYLLLNANRGFEGPEEAYIFQIMAMDKA